MKNMFPIMILLIFIPSYALTAPTVSSVSGKIVDGQSIIISGSGFGNKTTPTPLVFLKDNIEAGTPDSSVSASMWTNTPDSGGFLSPKYTDADAHSGNQSIKFRFLNSQYGCYMTYDAGSGFDKLYYTAWIKIVKNDAATKFQWKSIRLNDKNQYAVSCSIIEDNWWGSNPGIWGNNDIQSYYSSGTKSDVINSISSNAYLFNSWMRIEGYYQRASGNEVGDGVVWHTRIGKSGIWGDATNVITHAAGDGSWRYILLGMYYSNLVGATNRDATFYYDDIYLDKTLARVEIGNNKIFSDCNSREIQYPTSWSSTSITITLNRGNFDPCQTYYLFVVDENGNNNSTGYPIKIITGAGEAPCPPTGLESSN